MSTKTSRLQNSATKTALKKLERKHNFANFVAIIKKNVQ